MPGVLLISDRKARLKPCLRCGYSLCHIAGARNCPECGLAVRISLSGNTALAWSNPRWLRFLAAGALLFAVAHLLYTLNWVLGLASDFWVISGAGQATIGTAMSWATGIRLAFMAAAVVLLAAPERRYPDDAWWVRLLVLGIGLTFVALWLLRFALIRPELLHRIPGWYWSYVLPLSRGNWQLLVLDLLELICVAAILHRDDRGKYAKYVGFIIAPPMVAFLLGSADQTNWLWWIDDLMWCGIYAPGVAALLIWAAVLFGRSAKEAGANWQSDL